MPTSSVIRAATVLSSQQWINGVNYDTMSVQGIYSHEKITPPTTFRRKPADLFANSTSRLVTSKQTMLVRRSMTKVVNNPSNFTYGFSYSFPSLDTLTRNEGLRPLCLNPVGLDNELLGKIKGQKANLSMTLAKLGKCTDMVFELARDMVATIHFLRSGRPLRMFWQSIGAPRSRADKRLARKWLEYQYGWMNLARSIYGLSQVLQNEIISGTYFYVDVHRTFRYNFSSSGYAGDPITRDRCSIKAKARYKVDANSFRSLSQSGITNPTLVIWDIIPYSFVFDWVIDVSSWLSALDALTGVTDLLVIRSAYYERTEQQKSSPGTYVIDRGEWFGRERITNRQAPVSGLSIRPPAYNPSMGVTRMINAVALLRNLRK